MSGKDEGTICAFKFSGLLMTAAVPGTTISQIQGHTLEFQQANMRDYSLASHLHL